MTLRVRTRWPTQPTAATRPETTDAAAETRLIGGQRFAQSDKKPL